MRCRYRLLAFACLAPLIGLSVAQAQSLPPEATNPAVRAAAAACGPDIRKFCVGVVPGGGRIVRCLVENQSGLSPSCASGLIAAKAALGR